MSTVQTAPDTANHLASGRSIARRASWGFLDQMLSSGSNFALSAFVAANVSAAAFGAFSLAYAAYGVCVALSCGLASIPLVVRYSAAAPAPFRAATRASVGTALAVGTVSGILCLGLAAITGPAVAGPLRVLAISLPGLLIQDAWRYSFVTGGHPAKAAANDGCWVLLQLIGIAVLLAVGTISAVSMVLVWGGSASAAALLGCWQARMAPAPLQTPAWLRAQRSLTWRYAAEAILQRSGPWVGLVVVGAIAGVGVVGALRGALLLMGGPLNLLFLGATFVFVPEGVRLLQLAPARLPVAMRSLGFAAAGAASAWCIVVLLLPDAVGLRVLGSTWPHAVPLLAPLALLMVSLGASLGFTQGMLALGAARRSLFTQFAGLSAELPSMASGAALAGARGAAIATGLTGVFRALLARVQFHRALGEPAASVDGGTDKREMSAVR